MVEVELKPWRKYKMVPFQCFDLNPATGKYIEAEPLPNLSGITFGHDVDRPSFNLSTVINLARASENTEILKRTVEQHMDRAAWGITWQCLKRRRPELAKLLSDPDFKAMQQAFNAEIYIDVE